MEFPIIASRYDHVNVFVNQLAPIVCNEYLRRKEKGEHLINPSVCIAQACLESGYNLNASTLFGIKGSDIELDTTEYINGKYVNVKDSFAAYPSVAGAVQGYYDLMQWDNYTDATTPIANSWEEQIEGLTNNIGYAYATSPTYRDDISSIIKDYNLIWFDMYVEEINPSSVNKDESISTDNEEIELYVGKTVGVITDDNGNVYDTNGTLCHCWYSEYTIIDINSDGVCLGVNEEVFARIPFDKIKEVC